MKFVVSSMSHNVLEAVSSPEVYHVSGWKRIPPDSKFEPFLLKVVLFRLLPASDCTFAYSSIPKYIGMKQFAS